MENFFLQNLRFKTELNLVYITEQKCSMLWKRQVEDEWLMENPDCACGLSGIQEICICISVCKTTFHLPLDLAVNTHSCSGHAFNKQLNNRELALRYLGLHDFTSHLEKNPSFSSGKFQVGVLRFPSEASRRELGKDEMGRKNRHFAEELGGRR